VRFRTTLHASISTAVAYLVSAPENGNDCDIGCPSKEHNHESNGYRNSKPSINRSNSLLNRSEFASQRKDFSLSLSSTHLFGCHPSQGGCVRLGPPGRVIRLYSRCRWKRESNVATMRQHSCERYGFGLLSFGSFSFVTYRQDCWQKTTLVS